MCQLFPSVLTTTFVDVLSGELASAGPIAITNPALSVCLSLLLMCRGMERVPEPLIPAPIANSPMLDQKGQSRPRLLRGERDGSEVDGGGVSLRIADLQEEDQGEGSARSGGQVLGLGHIEVAGLQVLDDMSDGLYPSADWRPARPDGMG